jgi:hypothetical protein
MWIEVQNKKVTNLNTTFEKSLEKWLYLVSLNFYKNNIGCVTKDFQYSFLFNLEKQRIFQIEKEIKEWDIRDSEEIIECRQALFTKYRNHIFYFKESFTKADLQNSQKLIEFITKQSTNNVLNQE